MRKQVYILVNSHGKKRDPPECVFPTKELAFLIALKRLRFCADREELPSIFKIAQKNVNSNELNLKSFCFAEGFQCKEEYNQRSQTSDSFARV